MFKLTVVNLTSLTLEDSLVCYISRMPQSILILYDPSYLGYFVK